MSHPAPHLPLPSPAQLAWHRTEMNLFVHFGMNTFTSREWGDGTESPALFNPTALDCRQWARVAREAGFKIGILTAKHHDGFCLWPTATTEHSVKSSPWRGGHGDLVREFVDAFRAEGLEVGLYLSPWDRNVSCYGDSPRYNDLYCAQLVELLTGYGPLREVWFDGACAEGPNGRKQNYDWPRYFDLVKQLQPGAVTFGDGGTDVRWVGNERGFAGETCWSTIDPELFRFPGDSGISDPNDARAHLDLGGILGSGQPADGQVDVVWRPPECDVSIRPGWFYHETENTAVRSVENLVELYFQSAGRNSLFLLNIPPTPAGLFHEADIAAVTGLRRELNRLFARNVANGATAHSNREHCSTPAANVLDGSTDTWWAPIDDTPGATLEITFPREELISILAMEEPIQLGQRVSAYRVEALDGAGHWRLLVKGTTIGRRKLDRMPAIHTRSLRIAFESFAVPAISAVQVF